jgi:hypothetical protein
MKPIRTILFILLVMLSTGLRAQSLSLSKLAVPLSEPGKPYQLTMDLKSDMVNLSVYDGKEIMIDITSTEKKERPAGNSTLLIQSGSSRDIIAQENNNSVSITSAKSRRDAVSLNIKIPVGATSIKLAMNEGTISASGISGDIEVNNLHGNILLNNVSGSVVASSNQGSIIVSFKAINPNSAMAFTTIRGDIKVSLPATFKGNVKLRSYRGDVYSDFDIATENAANKITKTASGGVYSNSDNWLSGKINGGGQELMMKTYLGDIYLHKIK